MGWFPSSLHACSRYLSTISAVEANCLGERGVSFRVVRASIPFILGFSAVFVALGASAGAAGNSFGTNQRLLLEVAGFIIIVQ